MNPALKQEVKGEGIIRKKTRANVHTMCMTWSQRPTNGGQVLTVLVQT